MPDTATPPADARARLWEFVEQCEAQAGPELTVPADGAQQLALDLRDLLVALHPVDDPSRELSVVAVAGASETLLRAAAAARQMAGRAVEGPWEVTDCEGNLAVSAGRARPRWNDAMTAYRPSGSYPPEARILEHDLDTWDRDQDSQDDAQRDNAHWIALVGPEVGPPLADVLDGLAYYRAELAPSLSASADVLAGLVLANEERNSRAF